MSLPGFGFVLMIGTALAGILYLLIQENNQHRPHGHGGGWNCGPQPVLQIEQNYDTNPRRRRRRSSVEGNSECTICLENIRGANGKKLPCSHVFHSNCIEQWLHTNNICPLCRTYVADQM